MSKILCVEDDDDSAFMLKQRLQRQGYEVVIAINGEQGVSMARSERPDLILMDIDLPIINGLDATRILKGEPETGTIPIVALTAHAMADDREAAMQAGCDDFDTKPVNLAGLLEKMKALLPGQAEIRD